MEVIVHGTKGGYRILDKTPNAPSIASDIRNNAVSKTSLGKSIYAIAFFANGIVFSKYKIVNDTLRSSATGFIAFSLYVPEGEKLSGADAKSLLDELQSHYLKNYVTENQMNRGERVQIIQEDWTFIPDILNKYTTLKVDSNNQIQPGTKDAAFVCYNSENELIEYFNKPFQKEFYDYKQVFLIQNELKEKYNILDVFRNSGIELKIDLKNDYFYLKHFNSSKDVTFTANGKSLSERTNNNVIRLNDNLEIRHVKDDRYYFPIEASGTLSDLSSKIHDYIEKKGNQINIRYEAFNNPRPKTKTIFFDVRDRNGNPVSDVEIRCDGNYQSKIADNNIIIFRGEELGESWTVSAKKGNHLFSENHKIDFRRDCSGDDSSIRLQLSERKKVSFKGILESVSYDNIKVTIEQKKIYEVAPEVVFLNEEIENRFTVIATYQKDGMKYSGQESFTPKDNDSIRIQMQKEKVKTYIIDEGKHGDKIENCPSYSEDKQGEDVKSYIKPKLGWKFTGFKLENSQKNPDGKIVAQYKRNYITIVGVILVPLVLIISVGVWWFWPKENSQKVLLTEYDIEQYVDGTELNLVVLDSFKTTWGNQNTVVEKEDEYVWYNPITWIESNELTSEPIDDGNWEKVSGWIDNAVKKRNSINELNFILLKDSTSTRYSDNQLKFKDAIKVIDSAQYDTIYKRFKDVSKWNLNQIADSITEFLKPKVIESDEVEEDSASNSQSEPSSLVSPKNETSSNKVNKKKVETTKETKKNQPSKKQTGSNEKTSKIKKELQSERITKEQLKKYKQENDKALNESIDLYLEFWKLVNDSNQKNDFDKLLDKVKGDVNLKNSALKKFLDSICAGTKAFEKYLKVRPKPVIKNIKEFNEKYNLP